MKICVASFVALQLGQHHALEETNLRMARFVRNRGIGKAQGLIDLAGAKQLFDVRGVVCRRGPAGQNRGRNQQGSPQKSRWHVVGVEAGEGSRCVVLQRLWHSAIALGRWGPPLY